MYLFLLQFQEGKSLLRGIFRRFCHGILAITPTISPSPQFGVWMFLSYPNFLFIFGGHACGILVLWPGITPRPSAVKVWSPKRWVTKGFPLIFWIWGYEPKIRVQNPSVLSTKLCNYFFQTNFFSCSNIFSSSQNIDECFCFNVRFLKHERTVHF